MTAVEDVRLQVLDAIAASRIIAILRASSPEFLMAAGDALAAGGIRCLEVTLTTPGALAAIRELQSRLPHLHVGAGTVRTGDDAEAALAAGARFLVSPSLGRGVAEVVGASHAIWIAGAMSPTEIEQAHALGAAAIKVFPVASVGGPAYIRAVHAPLPDVALIPTGGIAIDDIPAYLAAGGMAVGLGQPLLGDSLAGGSLLALRGRAGRAVAAASAEHIVGPRQ